MKMDWIKHTGNKCPVKPKDIVVVMLRYRGRGPEIAPAKRFNWAQAGKLSDIDYYFVLTKAPRKKPWKKGKK